MADKTEDVGQVDKTYTTYRNKAANLELGLGLYINKLT